MTETGKINLAKGKRLNLANIVSARVLLSFSYGFLNVLLSLYLHHLGYSLIEIGLILGGAILLSSALSFLLTDDCDSSALRVFNCWIADEYSASRLAICVSSWACVLSM